MINFKNIDYLKVGDEQQRKAWEEITGSGLFQKLSWFSPVLTGTIPIGISISGSDLDILCEFKDQSMFNEMLKYQFGGRKDFTIKKTAFQDLPTTIATFKGKYFPIEIFGQKLPVDLQYAWQHMIIEHQILERENEEFRSEIIRLKKEGLSTESAFCKILNISGDPYEELLNYGRRNFS